MSVSVDKLGATPEVGNPKCLFRVAINDGMFTPYDAAPDGQRFLVALPEPPDPLLFIQSIEELLKRGQ
jgi:hypothetical protein